MRGYVWFVCDTCGRRQQRYCNAKVCIGENHKICGRLARESILRRQTMEDFAKTVLEYLQAEDAAAKAQAEYAAATKLLEAAAIAALGHDYPPPAGCDALRVVCGNFLVTIHANDRRPLISVEPIMVVDWKKTQ